MGLDILTRARVVHISDLLLYLRGFLFLIFWISEKLIGVGWKGLD